MTKKSQKSEVSSEYSYEAPICEIGNKNTSEKIEIIKTEELEVYAIKLGSKTEAFYLFNNNYQLELKMFTEIEYEGKIYKASTFEYIKFDHFLGLCEYLETADWSDQIQPLKRKKK